MADVYTQVAKFLDANPPTSEVIRVKSAMALQLALKLDEAVADTSAGSAQATPGISKELRAVLDDIRDASAQKQDFIASIFDQRQ